MSILTNELPKCISVKGVEVPINTDFRASIQYIESITNPELGDRDRVISALLAYFPNGIDAEYICEELLEQMSRFYQGGKTSEQIRLEKKKESMTNGKEGLSYSIDADLIQAAFMRDYGIDLSETKYLHWWKFLALLQGLSDDNELVKIMGYRTMKIDRKMPHDQQKFYKRLQAKYALPVRRHKDAETINIEQQLMNGTFSGLEV